MFHSDTLSVERDFNMKSWMAEKKKYILLCLFSILLVISAVIDVINAFSIFSLAKFILYMALQQRSVNLRGYPVF